MAIHNLGVGFSRHAAILLFWTLPALNMWLALFLGFSRHAAILLFWTGGLFGCAAGA
jgi:hypothetical protein